MALAATWFLSVLTVMVIPALDGRDPREVEAEPFFRKAVEVARTEKSAAILDAVEAALRAGACPTRVLTEEVFAGLHVEERFHDLIREHARPSSTVLTLPGEPGTPMQVSGVVRDADSRPIAGALVYVFHTDAKGEYTPTHAMDEPHSRIFGYLRTDDQGRYAFKTIRPGGYAKSVHLAGRDRLIPQHIHFEISADGFRPRVFQLVFDDDPRMEDHWRNVWAPAQGFPIAMVTLSPTGLQSVAHDITLTCEMQPAARPRAAKCSG